MAAPTAQEQYFLELINRARLNPLAEAQRYGIDLNKDLPAGTLNALQKQPLAFNFLLNDSADAHSNWMLSADVFSHTGSGSSSPMQRMQAAGYSFTGNWWNGENIAYVGSSGAISIDASIDSLHRNLFLSAGHRENILNGAFREIGVGVQQGVFTSGGVNWNAVMATENFATSGSNKFVSGVVYNDSNRDGFYSIGEGLGGITASVKSGSSLLASQASWSAGGFSLASNYSGGVTVEFSDGGLAQQVGATFFLSGDNAKIDLVNGNTIKSSVSVQLTGAALGLELLGINSSYGYGNSLNNVITGNSGANTLAGIDGNDSLFGGGGDDHLLGGKGGDTINGGAGSDWSLYDGSSGGVQVNLVGATASGADAEGDILSGIEHLRGSIFSDVLVGDNTNNILIGAGGSDTLVGLGGNDYLYGGEGNDWLAGSAGSDRIDGEGGSDWVNYADATAAVSINLLAGTLGGNATGDQLFSIENLWGSAFGDSLRGNAGANYLSGQGGNDTLTGEGGADLFVYSSRNFGGDLIADFQSGVDHLYIAGTVASSMANVSIFGNGTNSVILIFGGGAVQLQSSTTLNLTAADFIFA